MVKFTFRFFKASFFLALALLGIAWKIVGILASVMADASHDESVADPVFRDPFTHAASGGYWNHSGDWVSTEAGDPRYHR